MTENSKKIYANITHNSYSIELQCIVYYCLPRGACTVPSIESKYSLVRDNL